MNKFNFGQVIKNIEAVKKDLPRLMANDAQNYFLASFRKQSFGGKSWAQVQRRIPGTAEYKYPKTKGLARRTKPINILTGKMRRAVSNTAASARISYSQYNFKVTMTVSNSTVPYAGYINDGTSKMVSRPFMKGTPELTRILRNRVNNYINKVWRG